MPILIMLLSLLSPQLVSTHPPADWTEHRLIAHAMGGIDDHAYTNSYDAFVVNYEKGFRVFEVDLLLTSDGQLVARHDWTTSLYKLLDQENPGMKNEEPLSLTQFKQLPIEKKYRALDFDDILLLMQQYPDIYIVTDTKSTESEQVRKQFQVLSDKLAGVDPSVSKRFVPQLYNRKMYDVIEDVYPFDSYIYTLYESPDSDKQVLRFVKDTPKVKAVTMSENRFSPSFAAALNKLGLRTYVHTINDLEAFDRYRQMGVFGIYTDFIEQKDVEIADLRRQTPPLTPVRMKTH